MQNITNNQPSLDEQGRKKQSFKELPYTNDQILYKSLYYELEFFLVYETGY